MSAPGARAQPEPARRAVDVAIVNWNTAGAAAAAARAYLASSGVDVSVTIVDNVSEPAQRAELERLAPEGARLVWSERNLGFGAGANLGLAGGEGELVCVSNADVVPEPEALARLAEFCSDPERGMVGPAFAERSAYHAELPRAGALLVRPLVGGFGHRHVDSPPPGEVVEVGQPAGACFVVRREVWERLGGFDEDFFLWYEDVDLARRLRDAGLRNYVLGDAVVHHEEGVATGSLSPAERQAARLDGLERYLRKHHRALLPLARPPLALARLLRARTGTTARG